MKTPISKAQPGDYVEVHFSKLIYEGILLESPEDEKGILLLKLDSGYDIGFNKKDVLKIRVLRKFREEKKEKAEIKKQKDKPTIALIITGGTIASRLNPRKGGVEPITSSEDLLKYYPEIFERVNVKVETPFMKASEDMDFKSWIAIAKVVEKNLKDGNIKGVIVTHGTDFLHYTAAALSFFLRNLNKPVVLTYSQRSIDRASSDANLNLQCSALAAISDIAEVMLVGHATINDDFCYALPGAKVRKMHSSRRDAFKVINGKPIAKIVSNVNGSRIEVMNNYNSRNSRLLPTTASPPPTLQKKVIKNMLKSLTNNNKTKLDAKFEPKVALVKIYPGQNPEILDYYLKKKYKGIVLELSGLGHLPVNGKNSWIRKLKEVQKKIFLCATTQTIYGRVDPYVYSNGREILKTGVVYLEDMLSETALVKLGWVLGHSEWNKNKETIKEKMLENFAGEISERLEVER
ncbi:MAG: Glu-tRNA(Gln) amidotransferase subunit GatD [archaeon]